MKTDFNIDKVMSHCDGLESTNEQIDYLEWVLKEHKKWCLREGLTGKPPLVRLSDKVLAKKSALIELNRRFARIMKAEIQYRRNLLKRRRQSSSTTKGESEKKPAKILWLGTEAQLVYLIESLIEGDFLPDNMDKWSLIERLFVNKNNQPFKSRQLAQTSQNLLDNKQGKPKGSDKLDKIKANLETKSE